MSKGPHVGWKSLPRRRFLQLLGGGGFGLSNFAANRSRMFPPTAPAFEEMSPSATKINWTHSNGRSPEWYLPETVGAGCGFLDYDNDGWMDIYLVNSGPCDFYAPPQPLRNALYRNNRDGTFTDVTEKAGVSGNAYGMGVAVGDYDADGFPDLYVTQYPRSILYHNNGDGTFTDVTAKAGVAAPGWGSSAVWFDYDNDGRLDLFVCRFVDFDKSKNKFCGNTISGERWYCKPNVYGPEPSYLFHNNGDGTFTDVSKDSGIAASLGKAWGVVAADINQDGWMDLFVANVDQEMYALYHNNKDETFTDVSIPTGIGPTTQYMSGWGLKFFDYDNDGNLDLFLCNGHPDDEVEKRVEHVTYREPLLLFRNTPNGFKNVSLESGPIFSKPLAARGMALGDFDNDGSVDVLIATNNGAPVLLRNNAGRQNHWLGLHLIGRKSNIDAVGAKVTYRSGDLERTHTKVGGGSYLAAHDPRIVLGLGPHTKIDWLEIRWPQPSGIKERFTEVPIDRYITITEGQAKWK